MMKHYTMVCGVICLLVSEPASGNSSLLGPTLTSQHVKAHRMERLLRGTPLPARVKSAPTKILRSSTRAVQSLRGRLLVQKKPAFDSTSRVLFSDGRTRTVNVSSTYENQPSYGFSLAQQSMAVVDHDKNAPGLFGGSINTNRAEQIEIQSRDGGWKSGLSMVKHIKGRTGGARGFWRWKTAVDRQLHSSYFPVENGRWLMKRSHQANRINARDGTVKKIGDIVERHYLFDAAGKRRPLTKEQYHAIYGQEILGFKR